MSATEPHLTQQIRRFGMHQLPLRGTLSVDWWYNRCTGSRRDGDCYMFLNVWKCTVLSVPVYYDDVIMSPMAYKITSLTIVYSTVYSDADQRIHQSSASLALCAGYSLGPVNSPHKWPVTRKMSPFDDVIIILAPAMLQRDRPHFTVQHYPLIQMTIPVFFKAAEKWHQSRCSQCTYRRKDFINVLLNMC